MVAGPGFNWGGEFGCPTCRVYTWGISFDPFLAHRVNPDELSFPISRERETAHRQFLHPRKGQVVSFCPSEQFRWSSPSSTMNRDRLLSLPIQLATSPEPSFVPVPRPAPPPADRFASPRRNAPQSAFTVCLPFVFMVLRIAFPATPFL